MVNGTDVKYDNLIFTRISVISNIILAIGKIIVGAVTGLYFLCVAGCFNFMMGGAKGTCLYGLRKNQKVNRFNNYIGCLLMLAGSIYALYMGKYILFPSESFKFSNTLAIAIAAVAFYEMGVAIYGIMKIREHTTLYRGIKIINLASSLTAIAFAQVALLSFNDDIVNSRSKYNGIMGGIVGALCVVLGLYLIIAPYINAIYIRYKAHLYLKRPIISYRISDLGSFVNNTECLSGVRQSVNVHIDYPYCEVLIAKLAGTAYSFAGKLEEVDDKAYIIRTRLCRKKLAIQYGGKYRLITIILKIIFFVVYVIPLFIYLMLMRVFYHCTIYVRLDEAMGVLGAVKLDLSES